MTQAHDDIRLHLLGDPKLQIASMVFPLERKDAGLLALLAVDGPNPRAKAAALLWPDVDEEAARNNLRQRLHRLRKRAGRDIAETTSDVLRLATGVVHDLGGVADILAHDVAGASGELLGGLEYADCEQFDAWLQSAREQWRSARRNALAEIASKLEKDGQIALALRYGERLASDEPLLEHAHRRLMRLHYLRGDRGAALSVFERCRVLLQQELGASPGRETLELAALIESSGRLPGQTAVAPRPVAVLRPPRLVGRESEWHRLEAAYEARRFVLVGGEPGIGKSRLLGDFAARRPGLIVVGARPGDARIPYVLLARLLRAVLERHAPALDAWVKAELARLLPELGAAPPGRLQPLRLQQAIVTVLGAAASPAPQSAARDTGGGGGEALAGFVVDDFHFADEASVETMLAVLATELATELATDVVTEGAGRALRWLGGVRSAEIPPKLADWLARTDTRDIERIDLGPLDAAAIEALLDSLSLPGLDARAWADPIARHTGGNPLFILETLNAVLAQDGQWSEDRRLALPAPGTVGQLIERRLAQLSPAALRLARVAALAAQDFSVELAARVLHVHPLDLAGAWGELESAQVIRDDAFAHDLIFEATLRSVPEAIARVMHRDIASELVARSASAVRVGQHWQQAAEWSRAAAAFSEAARDAHRNSQRAAEADLWVRAAECFDRAGAPDEAFSARFHSIEPLLLIHGVQRALAVADGLLKVAESPRQRVEALTARALACLMGADHGTGLVAAREAHTLAQSLDSPWLRFEAARLLAIGLALKEQAIEALAVIEPFHDLVEREGDIEQRGRFWADYAYVLNSARRLRRAAEALQRSIDIAREAGDFGEMATITSNYAVTLGNLGRVGEALEQSLRARTLSMQLGETEGPAGSAIDMYIGMHSGGLARYRDALANLDAALAGFQRAGQDAWIAVANNHKAAFLLELGQFGRAQKALDCTSPPIESVRARREILLSRIERALGHDGSAAIGRALAELGERGDPYMTMLVQLEEAQILPATTAVARCETLQATAERLEYLGIAAKARLARARHLLRAGETHAAASLLQTPSYLTDGVQAADTYGAEWWWTEYEAFAACGATVEATAALARAVDWINAVALPNVPDEFKDSFLNRNPINRAILTTASRRSPA